MDLITILLIIVFFVLPVIQQVKEGMKQKERERAPDEGVSADNGFGAEEPSDVAIEGDTGDGDWSDDWMSWPTGSDAAANEPVATPPEMDPPRRETRGEVVDSWSRYRDQPEERSARDMRPTREQVPEVSVRRVPIVNRGLPGERTAYEGRKRKRSIVELSDLQSKAGIRKAIVLAEVLGPPVSLRNDSI